MEISESELSQLNSRQLRSLADSVGVGYTDLDDHSLVKKLLREGTPPGLEVL